MKRPGPFALGIAAALSFFSAASAAPVKIRIGWIVPVEDIAPIAFVQPGIARHLGVSYTLEPIHFQGTPDMITALAVDQVDIGDLAFSSLGLAVQNAGMNDLRVIANEFDDGVGDYATNQFRVAKDGPIRTIADLKGKVLATNTRGSAVDLAMRAMLEKSGLEEARDYTIVESPLGAMKAMLAENKVALAPSILPFSEDPAFKGNSRVLFTEKQGMDGPSALAIWVAKAEFLQKNRGAVLDLLEDVMRATRWYLDPKNHDAAVQIASRFMKVPPSALQSWLFTRKDYYRNPNLSPDLQVLQANIDLQRRLGFLTQPIDVAQFADLSLTKEAAARLNQ
jgi:sulfonate transport system substrate-binding protein